MKENWKDYEGNLLTPEKVNLYDIKETIIKFRTAKYQCSYVELIASSPDNQKPKWFVSHWWGEPVWAFIKCFIRHAKDRGLSWDDPYWICSSTSFTSAFCYLDRNKINDICAILIGICE